jgi:hypothetical protein
VFAYHQSHQSAGTIELNSAIVRNRRARVNELTGGNSVKRLTHPLNVILRHNAGYIPILIEFQILILARRRHYSLSYKSKRGHIFESAVV